MLTEEQKSVYLKVLTPIFRKYNVLAAYIFGSVAAGDTHARSDLDLAIRFLKKPTLKKMLSLEQDCVEILGTNVDLVYFDEAPIPLKFRIIQARSLIYARDVKKEIIENVKIMSMYYDYSYYLNRFVKAEINRIAKHGI